MTHAIVTHEVIDGDAWAKAWHKGPGSRHEMFASIGIKARNFRDPNTKNMCGLILEIPDMDKFTALLQSPEGRKAMAEDGLKVGTMRMLTTFTP